MAIEGEAAKKAGKAVGGKTGEKIADGVDTAQKAARAAGGDPVAIAGLVKKYWKPAVKILMINILFVAIVMTMIILGIIIGPPPAYGACTAGGYTPGGGGGKPDVNYAKVAINIANSSQWNARWPNKADKDRVILAMFEAGWVESSWINNPNMEDHDSVGIWQMRPSQGWGTVQQLMDPSYASNKWLEVASQFDKPGGTGYKDSDFDGDGVKGTAGDLAAAVERPSTNYNGQNLRLKYQKREADAISLIQQVSGMTIAGTDVACGAVDAAADCAKISGDGPQDPKTGMVARTICLKNLVEAKWSCKSGHPEPCLKVIGGYRKCDAYPDHPTGHALDIMITPSGDATGHYKTDAYKKLGDEINAYMITNMKALGVKYTIWLQTYHNGSRDHVMEDRGSGTANHMDHVHVDVLGKHASSWCGGSD